MNDTQTNSPKKAVSQQASDWIAGHKAQIAQLLTDPNWFIAVDNRNSPVMQNLIQQVVEHALQGGSMVKGLLAKFADRNSPPSLKDARRAADALIHGNVREAFEERLRQLVGPEQVKGQRSSHVR